MKWTVRIVAAALMAAAGLVAAAVSMAAEGQPGPKKPALPPLTSRPAAERDAVLTRLEERSKTVESVSADFVQHVYAPVFDDHDTRSGSLKMLKPSYFRVDWKKPAPEGIVYDGTHFWEIKDSVKQVIRWTVAQKMPAAGGQPKLDEGPFKLLAGVSAAELRKDYLVALVESPKEAKTHHFLLVPVRPEERVEYLVLEVWIDRETLLPARIRFTKPNQEVETWTFKAMKVNAGVGKSDFTVRVPLLWTLLKDPA